MRPTSGIAQWATPHGGANNVTERFAGFLVPCDCGDGVMRGAKWLARHKMATLA